MSKLFLSGGGHANKTKKLDRLFEAHLPKSKRVLYIPIAMPPKKYTFGQCYDWIRVVFPKLKIDMWTDLSNRKFEDVNKYDAIYIGGGNTFYLLDQIRSTKFDKLLTKFYKVGGIIYGLSAGAIIFGKDIQTAGIGDGDKNLVGLTNFSGFNMVKNFSLQCHYSGLDDEEIIQYSKEQKTGVIGLPDDTGLVIAGKTIKVIGESSAVLFDNKSRIVYMNDSLI